MNIKGMSKAVFLNTYFMKDELQQFCRAEGLQSTGNKLELTSMIAHYLDTGEKLPIKKHVKYNEKKQTITSDTIITLPITFSEDKRAFFREQIGNSFHFYVPFQKWLKENAGKTYG